MKIIKKFEEFNRKIWQKAKAQRELPKDLVNQDYEEEEEEVDEEEPVTPNAPNNNDPHEEEDWLTKIIQEK